jgi:hypothetical protein
MNGRKGVLLHFALDGGVLRRMWVRVKGIGVRGVDWVELAKDRCSNTGILYTTLDQLSDLELSMEGSFVYQCIAYYSIGL